MAERRNDESRPPKGRWILALASWASLLVALELFVDLALRDFSTRWGYLFFVLAAAIAVVAAAASALVLYQPFAGSRVAGVALASWATCFALLSLDALLYRHESYIFFLLGAVAATAAGLTFFRLQPSPRIQVVAAALAALVSMLAIAVAFVGRDRETLTRKSVSDNDIKASIPENQAFRVWWNSWIWQQEPTGQADMRAGPSQLYTVVFDLAPYLFSDPGAMAEGVAPDPKFRRVLERVSATRLNVRVYPVIAGNALRLADDLPIDLEIDLRKLRAPEPPRQKDESFTNFAARVNAARAIVKVEAVRPGCAAVALAIWTKSTSAPEPLDYVSRQLVVKDARGRTPSCHEEVLPQAQMSSRLLSLLDIDSGRRADAALQVFQLRTGAPGAVLSAALLVAGEEHCSWVLPENLVEFLANPQALQLDLTRAHQGNGYRPAIERLTATLFPAPRDGEENCGLALLKKVSSGPRRATVMARLVDTDGSLRVLPLGLVDIGGGTLDPLGSKVDIVEPLPFESPGNSRECVTAWNVVFAESLLESPLCSATAPAAAAKDWPAFLALLKGDLGEPEHAEGLLLLAHQAKGSIYFDPNGSPYARPYELAKQFRRSSIAMLVACDVATVENEAKSVSWLSEFNSHGVDAELVSPFAVPSDFGSCLARHLAQEVAKATSADRPIELIEVFRRAGASVRRDLERSPATKAYIPALYEFAIAGDPSIRLCNR